MSNSSEQCVQREKAVAFVVARLTSSRLQAKQLRTIGDRRILDWIISHLKSCHELDEIVITTVNEEENKPLLDYAEKQEVKSFWYEGDVNHVTTRLRRAAESYNADICVLISADCPLLYPPAIDDLISEMRTSPQVDLLGIKPKEKGKPSMMQGVCVSRKTSWQKADDLSDTPQLKEHQFPIMWRSPEHFNKKNIIVDHPIYSVPRRLSIDTPADLLFQNTLYKRLIELGHSYSLPNALELLNDDADLVKINAHVHQVRFGEGANTILFATNNDTSRESNISLAQRLIETQAWPVVFCCEDDHTASEIADKNLRSTIGSLESDSELKSDQHAIIDLNTVRDSFDLIIVESATSTDQIIEKLNDLNVEVPVIQISYSNNTDGSFKVLSPNENHKQTIQGTYEFSSFIEITDMVVKLLN